MCIKVLLQDLNKWGVMKPIPLLRSQWHVACSIPCTKVFLEKLCFFVFYSIYFILLYFILNSTTFRNQTLCSSLKHYFWLIWCLDNVSFFTFFMKIRRKCILYLFLQPHISSASVMAFSKKWRTIYTVICFLPEKFFVKNWQT